MSAHVLDLLSAYLDGELPPLEGSRVAEHLGACPECTARLAALAALDSLARRSDEPPPEGYFEAFPARVRKRLSGERRARAARTAPAWAWAAAAVVVLGLATSVTVRQLLRDGTPRPAPSAAAAAPPTAELLRSPLPTAPAKDQASLPSEGDVRAPARTQDRAEAPAPALAPPARAVSDEQNVAAGRAAGELALQAKPELAASTPPVALASPPPALPAAPAAPAAATPEAEAGEEAARMAPPPRAAVQPAKARDQSQRAVAVGQIAGAGGPEAAFAGLLSRSAQTQEEARALREAWRSFGSEHPEGARGDEARVRVVEAGITAWRLGGDARDLALAREDAADYLQRPGSAQAERVRALLRSLPR